MTFVVSFESRIFKMWKKFLFFFSMSLNNWKKKKIKEGKKRVGKIIFLIVFALLPTILFAFPQCVLCCIRRRQNFLLLFFFFSRCTVILPISMNSIRIYFFLLCLIIFNKAKKKLCLFCIFFFSVNLCIGAKQCILKKETCFLATITLD